MRRRIRLLLRTFSVLGDDEKTRATIVLNEASGRMLTTEDELDAQLAKSEADAGERGRLKAQIVDFAANFEREANERKAATLTPTEGGDGKR